MRNYLGKIILWATISITIPNGVVNRSTAAFCATYNYQATINGQANSETPTQFTQKILVQFIKQVIISYESIVAGQAASQSQQSQTTSDVSGIQ